MAKLSDLVIDCRHAASLARFWQVALDDYEIAPYDAAEMERLADAGIHDIDDDPTVLLSPTGTGPRIWFQTVPEPKTTKNRVHIDVSTPDVESEIARLTGAGARRSPSQPCADVVVMFDPEGNEFCITGGI